MWFKVGYGSATLLVAIVDGAFLGGIAAIITAVGGVILGILAYRKGQNSNLDGNGWRAALDAKEQEILRLERELKRERRRGTHG